MVAFSRCGSARTPDASEITANDCFLQSSRSEYTCWGRSECLLMAESSRPLTLFNGDFGPEPDVRMIYFEARAKVSNRPKVAENCRRRAYTRSRVSVAGFIREGDRRAQCRSHSFRITIGCGLRGLYGTQSRRRLSSQRNTRHGICMCRSFQFLFFVMAGAILEGRVLRFNRGWESLARSLRKRSRVCGIAGARRANLCKSSRLC